LPGRWALRSRATSATALKAIPTSNTIVTMRLRMTRFLDGHPT
jgi:hypothetical protein